MKFALCVEGETEYRAIAPFFRRWFEAQRLTSPEIRVQRFEGNDRFLNDLPGYVQRLFASQKSSQDVIAVFGLLDWYRLPRRLTEKCPKRIQEEEERCAWAKREIETLVQHEQFRQYFAVQELEAWLLSEPSIFPTELRKELEKVPSPESVGHPAKFLNDLYAKAKRRDDYRKVRDGVELFSRLDPQIAYEKCPHLKAMLDEMLLLAQATTAAPEDEGGRE